MEFYDCSCICAIRLCIAHCIKTRYSVSSDLSDISCIGFTDVGLHQAAAEKRSMAWELIYQISLLDLFAVFGGEQHFVCRLHFVIIIIEQKIRLSEQRGFLCPAAVFLPFPVCKSFFNPPSYAILSAVPTGGIKANTVNRIGARYGAGRLIFILKTCRAGRGDRVRFAIFVCRNRKNLYYHLKIFYSFQMI